jgi:hypothetical protein
MPHYRAFIPIAGHSAPVLDDEAQELAELERRYPPDPNDYDPMDPAMEEAIGQARERWWPDR